MTEARGSRSVLLDSGKSSAFGASDCRAGVLTYFETRIGRLFRQTAREVPQQVMAHLLERYSGVGDRQDRLYRVVFSTTYRADLGDLGYGNVAALLKRVEGCRNRFMHGEPEAVDDSLFEELVAGLRDEYEGWIAVFNRRLEEARNGLS